MIGQANDTVPGPVEQRLPVAVSSPLPRVRLLRVAGELDLSTQPRLIGFLDDALRSKPRHLVLDMRGIRFMGASGLHAVVYAKDTSEHSGTTLHITGVAHEAVSKPMAIVGLDQVLCIHPTWTEALAAIACWFPLDLNID